MNYFYQYAQQITEMVTSCCLSLKDGTCRYKNEEMCTHIRCLLEKTLLQQFDTGLPHLAEDSQILHNQTDVFDLDD